MMNTISEVLFSLSSGLLYPVVILLLCLLFYALALCVISYAGYTRFEQNRKTVLPLLGDATAENVRATAERIAADGGTLYGGSAAILVNAAGSAARERYLSNLEVDIDRKLSRPRMLVKLGPMLGLMGTLIPMGPALTGLASGDMGAMAYNMEVAFATTVVGILVAAVGLVILQAEKRCYARFMNDLDFINTLLDNDEKQKA